MKKNRVFIHPSAIIEAKNIGIGTHIWAFSHIMKDVKIGKDCNIGDHVFIESGVCIGNYVTIKNNVMIWNGVTIEDGVFVGPGVIFTNDLYPRSRRFNETAKRYSGNWLKETLVLQGCSIGAGSIILCGITLGKFSLIGAGSIVTGNIPDYVLVFGNPAKKIGYVCKCGELLDFKDKMADCHTCKLKYFKSMTEKIRLDGK